MIRDAFKSLKGLVLCSLICISYLNVFAQIVPEQIIEIDLVSSSLESYTDQDGPNGSASIANIIFEDGQDVLELQGNTWKAIQLSPAVTLTPGAILQFDFKSTDEGEWQGLGFETNLSANDPPYQFQTFFKVYGTDNRDLVNRLYDNYSGSGEWQTYSIPVENAYEAQGTNGSAFPYLVFFNDNDNSPTFNDGANGQGDAYFRNVSIILPAYCEFDGDLCDFNGNGIAEDGIYVDCECESLLALNDDCENVDFNVEDVLSYQLSQDDDNGVVGTQPINCGAGLMVVQNSWKSIDFLYNVTQNTVLEVEFKSTVEGEIHAIGLDDDNNWGTSNPNEWGRIFQLYGTQTGLGQNEAFLNYPSGADADGWQSYTLPLYSTSYSNATNNLNLGPKSKLFFIGDDDASASAVSFFRNIRVYEAGECSYEDGELCEPPFIAGCPAPMILEADITGTATPQFHAEVEGTGDIVITYLYLGNEVVPGETAFEVGTHQILAVAENECGSAVCQCIEIVVECFDADNDGICNGEDPCPLTPGADIEACGDCDTDNADDGFAGWTQAATTGDGGQAGQFIGGSDLGSSWVLYANSGQTSELYRSLGEALEVNGQISVEMDNGGINSGGTVGIAFRNSDFQNLAEVYFVGGSANYFVNSANGQEESTIGYTNSGLKITFNLTSESTFDVTLTRLSDNLSQTLSGELFAPGVGSQEIQDIRLFNFNAGGGNDQFFNNLQVCQPQPLLCPEGQYLTADGCSPCPPGTFCPGDNTSNPCPLGTFQGLEGQSSCLPCELGFYQNEEGATSCLACEAGSFAPVSGLAACQLCPAGTFQGQEGAIQCEPCEAGTFQDQIGSIVCLICEEGTDSQSGAIACFDCVLDFVNLQFPGNAEICEGGSFSAFGQVFEAGLTDVLGDQVLEIEAEYALVNSDSNIDDPNSWAENSWLSADFNSASPSGNSNNDEYKFDLSNAAPGSYFYTFRYRKVGCDDWQIGGFPNGEWNGISSFVGQLTVLEELDADGDGFSAIGATCGSADDCDDNNPAINPGQAEILYNGLNDDCNEETADFNSGIFESYVILGNSFYDLMATSGNPDFNNADLGDYTCGSELILNGAENKTFKCTNYFSGDILNGNLYYRIYEDGATPGVFSPLNLPFATNDGESFGCNNQSWRQENAGIDLSSGLPLGDYTLEVYTTADHTYDDGVGGSGTHFSNNGGINYTASFSVVDIILPVISCPDDIDVFATSGAGAMVTYTAPVGTDNCPGATTALGSGLASGSLFPLGTTLVTYTVTDAAGNEASCSFNVTVTGLEPDIVCPADIILNNDEGQCGAVVYFVATESAGIPASTITYSIDPGSVFEVGTTQVTATAINAVGFDQCTFNVTVIDAEAPTISCPATNIEVNSDLGVCGAAVSYNADFGDNCSGSTIEQTAGLPSGSIFPIGTITNSFRVTDAAGLTATCLFDVIVADAEAPEALAQNVTVQLDASGNGSTTAAAVDNGSSDACGLASVVLSQTDFDCSHVGDNAVTLTVTDNNGNVSVANATVTVEDNVAPVATAQNVTVQLDASGNGSTTAAAVDNGSSDACGLASVVLSQTDFDCSHVGDNAVTLTVTDNNGNVSVANATVTVEDNVAPVAIAQNVTVQLDASGNGSTTAAAVDNGSSDACGLASVVLSQTDFDCSHVGDNAVTLTVTDNNGNVSVANATVTVEDNVAPVATAQNVTVQLDASGNGSTTAAAVDNGSSDACGLASVVLSQTDFDCSHVGDNAVTLTVTDNNGNVSVANATVTVEDNVAPVATAQNVTVQLDASGNGSTTAAAVDNGSSDACGLASVVLSQTDFDCSHVGDNAVTLTVTDNNGNVSVANATVTVEDNVAPVATAQNVTVQLDASGNGSTTAAAVDNGSSDACGLASVVLSQTDFDCSHVGDNAVTLTVTDNNGNVSVANATVTVEDNVAPVATAQNVTVQLDASGNGSTTAAAVDNGSSDACGVADLSLSQTDFDCSHVGANTVTLTVTDVNGNSSTAIATVMVVDGIAPTLTCPSVEDSYLTDASECSRTLSLEATTSDNCSSTLSYAVDGAAISFPYPFPLGSTEVTVSATDGTNIVNCSYTVDVIDEPTVSITSPQDGTDGEEDDIVTVYFGSDNVLNALGVTNFAQLISALDADCPSAVSYQWQVQNLQDDTAPSGNESDWVDIDMSANLTVNASGDADFHRAYRVVITNSIGETSTSNYIRVYSIDTRCKGPNKVKVCMVPNGNPNNAHEICVNINAVDAILENSPGSFIGPCDPDFKLITDQAPDIEVYPNPTRSQLKINYRPYLNERTRIELYSSTGQLVKLVFDGLTEANLYHNEIVEMTNYENGIYLLRIIDSQGVHTERVILTK